MSRLARIPAPELDADFNASAPRPDAEIIALHAAAIEEPKTIMQQQRPRYSSAAEEREAMRQQQMDGYGSLSCRF